MDLSIFKELGMTSTETTLYLSMLELGNSTAGDILNKSKLPNSTLHRDLNSLIEKGILTYIKEGKRNVYQPTEPENLLDIVDETKRKLKELLPELKKKQTLAKSKENATIFKSIRGIKEVYSIMISTKAQEYNTYGGGPITSEVMGFTWWLNLHKRRVDNKLQSRQVFDESVRWGGKDIAKNPLTKIRYLDQSFAQFQETVIVGHKVAIAVFTKKPYAFLIEDEAVADSYRKHFEILWNTAKP